MTTSSLSDNTERKPAVMLLQLQNYTQKERKKEEKTQGITLYAVCNTNYTLYTMQPDLYLTQSTGEKEKKSPHCFFPTL